MTEYNGRERREHLCDPQDYIGRLEHNEICHQMKEWVSEKVIGKGWLIGMLLTIIIGLFGMTGYLIQYGGFAKDSDLKALKYEVMTLGSRFAILESTNNNNNALNSAILKSINENGKKEVK
jgi:hypothetical protein